MFSLSWVVESNAWLLLDALRQSLFGTLFPFLVSPWFFSIYLRLKNLFNHIGVGTNICIRFISFWIAWCVCVWWSKWVNREAESAHRKEKKNKNQNNNKLRIVRSQPRTVATVVSLSCNDSFFCAYHLRSGENQTRNPTRRTSNLRKVAEKKNNFTEKGRIKLKKYLKLDWVSEWVARTASISLSCLVSASSRVACICQLPASRRMMILLFLHCAEFWMPLVQLQSSKLWIQTKEWIETEEAKTK